MKKHKRTKNHIKSENQPALGNRTTVTYYHRCYFYIHQFVVQFRIIVQFSSSITAIQATIRQINVIRRRSYPIYDIRTCEDGSESCCLLRRIQRRRRHGNWPTIWPPLQLGMQSASHQERNEERYRSWSSDTTPVSPAISRFISHHGKFCCIIYWAS